MAKKQLTVPLRNQNKVLYILIAVLIVWLLLLSSFMSFFWTTYLQQESSNNHQIYELLVQNARQEICIDEKLNPCTQATITSYYDKK